MYYSFLTALSWSLTGIFIAFIDNLNFIEITWGRSTIALAIFIPFTIKGLSFRRSDILLSSLMSLYYISATTAFTLAPVSCVALLISASPFFTVLMKYIQKHNISKESVVGSITGFLGMFVFFSTYLFDKISISNVVIYGCLLSLLSAFFKSLYSFNLNKKPSSSSKNLTSLTFIITSTLLFPFISLNNFLTMSNQNYFPLLMLAVVSTILPTLFNSIASKKIDSTIHTSICLITPIFASFLAYLFLNQELYFIQVIGTLITIFGILISHGSVRLSRI